MESHNIKINVKAIYVQAMLAVNNILNGLEVHWLGLAYKAQRYQNKKV